VSVRPSEVKPRTDVAVFEPDPSRWNFGLRHLVWLIVYCAIFFWLIATLKVIGAVIVVGALVTMAIVSAIVGGARMVHRQDALIHTLAIATSRDVPLAPALEAFAEYCGRRYRRVVQTAAFHLRQGASLSETLDRVPSLLPTDFQLLARIASECGTFPQAVREFEATRSVSRSAWNGLLSRITYFVTLLWTAQAVLAFLFYFIMPRFEAIFRDFGLMLPSATVLLIHLTRTIAGHPLVLIGLVAFEIGLLWLVGVALRSSLYRIPLVDRLFARRHSALVLRSLAWVVDGGKPLQWGIDAIARKYPTRWVQRALERVSIDVTHGENWMNSLVTHGLIRPTEAAILESAQRVGNLPWALHETAGISERRLSFRLQAIQQLLFPLALILAGSVVVLVGIAVIGSLASLVEALAPG
jgi:protein transport protein HofC